MAERKPIYVETTIRTDMETLWAHTQRPELHREWDLRFSDITYNPRSGAGEPQTFTYLTRIGFGLQISGTGQTVSKIAAKSDMRLSTLTFESDHPLSLIRRGAGYWKYAPAVEMTGAAKAVMAGGTGAAGNEAGAGAGNAAAAGIRFATQYDYRTRFGLAGRLFDRWLFRPAFGRATAWSFDALRIWLEAGIPPRVLIRQAAIHYTCAAALACLWICQGLLPKLLFPPDGELAIMHAAAPGWLPGSWAPMLIRLLGVAEIGIGTATIVWHRSRTMMRLQIMFLLLMAAPAAAGDPAMLTTPYNPAALGAGMIALCVAVLCSSRELPRAGRCLRRPNRLNRTHRTNRTNGGGRR